MPSIGRKIRSRGQSSSPERSTQSVRFRARNTSPRRVLGIWSGCGLTGLRADRKKPAASGQAAKKPALSRCGHLKRDRLIDSHGPGGIRRRVVRLVIADRWPTVASGNPFAVRLHAVSGSNVDHFQPNVTSGPPQLPVVVVEAVNGPAINANHDITPLQPETIGRASPIDPQNLNSIADISAAEAQQNPRRGRAAVGRPQPWLKVVVSLCRRGRHDQDRKCEGCHGGQLLCHRFQRWGVH